MDPRTGTYFATPLAAWEADRPKYYFTLRESGTSFALSVVHSRDHRLSASYAFDMTLTSDAPLDAAALLNQPGQISLFGEAKQGLQEIHGIVSKADLLGRNLDKFEYRLILSSPLHPLKLNFRSRIFRKRSVLEIAEAVLLENGFDKQELEFLTEHEYPRREFVAQFQESDYDFLQRQQAYWGLF